jgi:hypothetical protein
VSLGVLWVSLWGSSSNAFYFIGCGAEVVALFLLTLVLKLRWLVAVGKIGLHAWWLCQARSFSCCVAGCSLAL